MDASDGGSDFAVDVQCGTAGTSSTVVASGELDIATADALAEPVREALRSGPVVLDLSAVTFLDSSGVRALDSLNRDSVTNGWNLRIRSTLHASVREVLELTGMLGVLPILANGEAG